MQESMVKFVLVLIALTALAFGGLLLVIPGWYVTFAEAEALSVGMLRLLGAGVLSLQGFGLVLVAFRRRDTNALLGFTALVTTAQIGAFWYALIRDEIAVSAMWAVIVPGIGATAVAVLLWAAWASRRRSIRLLPSGRAGTPEPVPDQGPAVTSAPDPGPVVHD